MGLSDWLRRRAAITPFVVIAPGGTAARLVVEREIRERGWRRADSPAAADLLIVAGSFDDAFGEYVDRVFDSMSLPRVHADITESDDAAAELDTTVARLHSGHDDAPPSRHESDSSAEDSGGRHDQMQETASPADHSGHSSHARDSPALDIAPSELQHPLAGAPHEPEVDQPGQSAPPDHRAEHAAHEHIPNASTQHPPARAPHPHEHPSIPETVAGQKDSPETHNHEGTGHTSASAASGTAGGHVHVRAHPPGDPHPSGRQRPVGPEDTAAQEDSPGHQHDVNLTSAADHGNALKHEHSGGGHGHGAADVEPSEHAVQHPVEHGASGKGATAQPPEATEHVGGHADLSAHEEHRHDGGQTGGPAHGEHDRTAGELAHDHIGHEDDSAVNPGAQQMSGHEQHSAGHERLGGQGHELSGHERDVGGQGHEMSGHEHHMGGQGHQMGGHDDGMGEQGHEMSGHEHHMGGHGHDMGMMLPGGLAMADRADDRDGLKLDVLTVPLGPVLAWWPAGLVVSARLQGDVVCDATVSVVAPKSGGDPFWVRPWVRAERGEVVTAGEGGRWRVARVLDSASTLLAVAGWEDTSTTAAWLRDETLRGAPSEVTAARLDKWARRVTGSRVLRWSLKDVGRIADDSGTPSGLAGDVHDRLLRWIAEVRETDWWDEKPLGPGGFVDDQAIRSRWILDALPGLLAGSELAEARLLVASLDPDLDVLTFARVEVAHG